MKCVCVAFVAVAGRRYTYTVCTYYLPADTEIGIVTTFRTIVAPCSQIPDTSTKRMYQAHDAEEASRGRSWPRQRTHPRNHGSHKPRRACGGADGPRASREPLSLSLSRANRRSGRRSRRPLEVPAPAAPLHPHQAAHPVSFERTVKLLKYESSNYSANPS